MSAERWLPVVGWEGIYEVSDRGRVRHVAPRRVLRPISGSTTRYAVVRLYRPNPRRSIVERIHVIVAAAFLGPRPKDLEVDHVNMKRLDNRARNLEYVTHQENIRRAARAGRLSGWSRRKGAKRAA